jgi:hypothetical protein
MDLSTFLPFILVIAILVAVAIADRRSGGEPIDPATFLVRPWEWEWPRGVQEEEFKPFRVDLIERRAPVRGSTDRRQPAGAGLGQPSPRPQRIG